MSGTYEPSLSREGELLEVGAEPLLAPGVRGYAILVDGRIHIPLVIAECEGSGAVGRFLDSVSPRCVFPTVMSGRLAGMLMRRGYVLNESTDIWERGARGKETER